METLLDLAQGINFAYVTTQEPSRFTVIMSADPQRPERVMGMDLSATAKCWDDVSHFDHF